MTGFAPIRLDFNKLSRECRFKAGLLIRVAADFEELNRYRFVNVVGFGTVIRK